MKHIIYSLIFIAIFLVFSFPGSGSSVKEKKDTLNTQQILQQLDSLKAQVKMATAPSKPHPQRLIVPKVTEVGALGKAKSSKHAVFGDYIYLKVDSIPALKAIADSISGMKKDTMGDVILYINGNAMRDLGVMRIDREGHELVFQLDRHSKYLMKFYPEFNYPWSKIQVYISVGFKNGLILPIEPAARTFNLRYVSSWNIYFSLLFIVSMVVCFVILASKTNLIRIGDDHSPFSLSLTQLSFWSIIVASSFIYIWIVTDELPPITGSTLILISVSALTTAGSRLVDIRNDTKKALQQPSDNFFEDILRDELGYSVHRAQMFMWTVIMGIVFVASVIRLQQIPQLDETLLGLMGISSGAYVGLKTMENKKADDPQAPVN